MSDPGMRAGPPIPGPDRNEPGGGELARLREAIGDGFLLPTRWYADPDIFRAELERIHRRAWHFATHTADLPEAGAVHVREVAGIPILLVRDGDTVRGFLNICRHRGHPVVTESGRQTRLTCPFHAWTYRLDGTLQHAPRSDGAFDPACFGLVAIQTHVWGPMIWVNLDPAAPAFERWVDGMPELLLERGLDVREHTYGFDHSWDIDSNWKVFQDNTIECYHCPTTHPELARVLEMKPSLQTFGVGGRYWIHHTIPFRDGFQGSLTTKRVEGVPFNYYYHWVFPTTYLQYSGLGFDIGSVDVVAVDKIRFRHVCFLPEGTAEDVLRRGRRQLERDATIQQDVGLCNRVQRGHAGGMAPTARVLPEPEFLLSHFHRVIVDMMDSDAASAAR